MMKKIFIISIFFLGVILSTRAQNLDAVKSMIEKTAQNMKTMQCDFVQTKRLKMLDEKMVSEGKMFYQQSNKLRWEYTSPYSYVFLLNDNKVVIKNKYRRDEINIQQNKIFKEIVRIMMNSVVGKCLSDDKRFKVSLQESKTEWIADLTPQSKDMSQMFRSIRIHFNRQAVMVSTVELFEKNGDQTIIQLKNIQQNKTIDEKVFSVSN